MCATGTRFAIMDGDESYRGSSSEPMPWQFDSLGTLGQSGLGSMEGKFKLILSSSTNSNISDENVTGIRIYTASLDPANDDYIANVLNTDPAMFQRENHLLYAEFPVENELATVSWEPHAVGLLSGSAASDESVYFSSLSMEERFGRFDTRYTTPRTPSIISQPFGETEYDLFHFETISDGAVANTAYKISISNIKRSSDKGNPWGTFTVEVRDFSDTDKDKRVLEQYTQCDLNPASENYVARKVGDYRLRYYHDSESVRERELLVQGRYPNQSNRIRIVMNVNVEDRKIPSSVIPFGFRGVPVLKTNDTLTDSTRYALSETGGRSATGTKIAHPTRHNAAAADRDPRLSLTAVGYNAVAANNPQGPSTVASMAWEGVTGFADNHLGLALTGSIVPPIPFRFKVTKGAVKPDTSVPGVAGSQELVDGSYYWGVMFQRIQSSGSGDNGTTTDPSLKSNGGGGQNKLIANYSKLLGLKNMGALVTGSAADHFHHNKFTLARVALMNELSGRSVLSAVTAELTGTAKSHMLEAAYIRNGRPNPLNLSVSDGLKTDRITLGTLTTLTASATYNRFAGYAKFSTFFYGGWDGTNILDKDMASMNDRGCSSESGGRASVASPSTDTDLDIGLHGDNTFGKGSDNSIVASYKEAANIMANQYNTRVNIVTVPGIRESAITDYVGTKVKEYSKAIYIMDMASYDDDKNRLFDSSAERPSVDQTVKKFDGRGLNNNYVATYFPDVTIEDEDNSRRVRVPASIAAIGALAYNDYLRYPWFAPAGFNRSGLSFVTATRTRLNSKDRDDLYEARINPIATFPNSGFVIFGQKTLQNFRSALDRVNVRRMLLEVKRQIVDVALKIVFEANTPETRAKFVAQVTPILSTIQSQEGIDKFKVIMDDSNNTAADAEANRLNGQIILVPTRAVEFIAMDFIITNSGVEFE
tara:strand:- start:42873 stop:45671 length:2799 start_codon:yes stop_codon:yes gene_type:complete